jgi:hypothetical protein
MVNVSLKTFLNLNHRARKPCQRRYIQKWKRYHDFDDAALRAYRLKFIFQYSPTLHDALNTARNELRNHHSAMFYQRYIRPDIDRRIRFGHWEADIDEQRETRLRRRETLRVLDLVRDIRQKAISSLEPASQEGRAFYVCAIKGADHRELYGPVATQAQALRLVDRVKAVLYDVYKTDHPLHWLGYGTMSMPIENATAGLLNAYFPEATFLPIAA